MKTIHMHTVHGEYTQEMKNKHPDYDCNLTIKWDKINKEWNLK